MRIFHVATAADWAAATRSGAYTTSTRGRTLAEEGFVHASRGDQWHGVLERFYGDVAEPLVLLVIERERLGVPVVDEAVTGTDETFPHIYGPIAPDAVVQVVPLGDGPTAVRRTAGAADAQPSFSRLFFAELFRNLLLATLLLVVVALGAVLGIATGSEWGPVSGATLGLAVGILALRVLARRHR